MKVLQIEQDYKTSHVIDQLNKLGFYATEGMSYRELKKQLVLERARIVKVGSSHSQWF